MKAEVVTVKTEIKSEIKSERIEEADCFIEKIDYSRKVPDFKLVP